MDHNSLRRFVQKYFCHLPKKLKLSDFYFLLHRSREIIVLGQIFEMEILMDLHVLRDPEYENHISSALSVCMCVCMSVCLLSA